MTVFNGVPHKDICKMEKIEATVNGVGLRGDLKESAID
jgi:hypothetical protein